MALITRISKLFTADRHAVLDRIEEPEVLLRQAIREMEEDLARSEQRVKWLKHEQENLETRRDDIEQSIEEIDGELDVCFESGKDDLARSLIKRKLEAQRLSKTIAAKTNASEKTLAELLAGLEENRGQLERMRQKAEVLTENSQTAKAANGHEFGWSGNEYTVGEDEVEVAFLREKQRRNPS